MSLFRNHPSAPRSAGPYGIVPADMQQPGRTHRVIDCKTQITSERYSHKDALHLRDWLELRARRYVERRGVFAMLDP